MFIKTGIIKTIEGHETGIQYLENFGVPRQDIDGILENTRFKIVKVIQHQGLHGEFLTFTIKDGKYKQSESAYYRVDKYSFVPEGDYSRAEPRASIRPMTPKL